MLYSNTGSYASCRGASVRPEINLRGYTESSNWVTPQSINFHLCKQCDSQCRFCFAEFRDVHGRLSTKQAHLLIDQLYAAGGEKITFAGGEPTLHPNIGELVEHAKRIGFVTGVVTNGSRLTELLENYGDVLDWAALSVDSANEKTQVSLGRGNGSHIERSVLLAEQCRNRGVRVKLNTVVTALNWHEDMSALVRQIVPERWKIFQVLRIAGQNDGHVESLLITPEQFRSFLERHSHLDAEGFAVVAEDNDAMTDSYVMIDPVGRFFGNSSGIHYTSSPILEVGVHRALKEVQFDETKFEARGGRYAW